MNYEGSEASQQLEIYTNFSLQHPLFKGSLKNTEYKVVQLFERPIVMPQEKQRDMICQSVGVVRTSELEKPTVVSSYGDILKGKTKELKVETADLSELENS